MPLGAILFEMPGRNCQLCGRPLQGATCAYCVTRPAAGDDDEGDSTNVDAGSPLAREKPPPPVDFESTEPPSPPRRSWSRSQNEPARPPLVEPDDDVRESTKARRQGWYELAGEEREDSMVIQRGIEHVTNVPLGESAHEGTRAGNAAVILFAVAIANGLLLLTGRTSGPFGALATAVPLLAGAACLRSTSWGRIASGVIALLEMASAAGAYAAAPNSYGTVLAGLHGVTVLSLFAIVISEEHRVQRIALVMSLLATVGGVIAVQVRDPVNEAIEVAGLPGNRWSDATGLAVQGPPEARLFGLDDPKFANAARARGMVDQSGVKAGILVDGHIAGTLLLASPPPGTPIADEVSNLDGTFTRSDDVIPVSTYDRAAGWTRTGGGWAAAIGLGDGRDLIIRLDGSPENAVRDRKIFEALVRSIVLPRKN
ncbi:MAG: hypothetical protein JST54_28295 [Deltaproteobacteria bacterium]|nr:hypothetical protein [Deltaproteobacteria bacterium]